MIQTLKKSFGREVSKNLKFEKYFNILDFKVRRYCSIHVDFELLILNCRSKQEDDKTLYEKPAFAIYKTIDRLGTEYIYILDYNFFHEKRKEYSTSYFIIRQNIVKFSKLIASKRKDQKTSAEKV